MGQAWELWGQDPFLSGFRMPPETEVSSFQGLGISGKILWCLLEHLFLGTHLKVPCQRTHSSSFPSGPGGRGTPMLMEHWQLISFF